MPTTEPQTGDIATEWYDNKGWSQIVDASYLISDIIAAKDIYEQTFIDQSSQLTAHLFKKFVKQIEDFNRRCGTCITLQELVRNLSNH
ncbi:unnamed protein product (macronuclear) [Paramecium tetraurelia]|uniref:Uncharacterized protein n=1 Tax=Paramecium tetraurelia TaxID=5888 RepID=A0BHI5_PARTE|nr:uncharacterized protein GSPATT00029037001 [Paramecium tetraurelia]CAK58002.1 unnamed protein product [Paramecium tetraurelia]|eukprot:XP_001425400.1 hypothetical protein (macronuclear) [Paramecium tetraurelia strain d4-2]